MPNQVNQTDLLLSKDDFMSWFQSERYYSDMSAEERRLVFLESLYNSEEVSTELIDRLFCRYGVLNLNVFEGDAISSEVITGYDTFGSKHYPYRLVQQKDGFIHKIGTTELTDTLQGYCNAGFCKFCRAGRAGGGVCDTKELDNSYSYYVTFFELLTWSDGDLIDEVIAFKSSQP